MPFSNGTQYYDWCARNCERCAKYNPDTFTGACEIDGYLGGRLIGAYEENAEMLRRMGYTDPLLYTWDCPERVMEGETVIDPDQMDLLADAEEKK